MPKSLLEATERITLITTTDKKSKWINELKHEAIQQCVKVVFSLMCFPEFLMLFMKIRLDLQTDNGLQKLISRQYFKNIGLW